MKPNDINTSPVGENVDDAVELSLELIYQTCPTEYAEVGKHLLTIFANFGEQLIKDCKATKTTQGNNILNCWLMFNSAISSYNLGNVKQATLLLDYVKKELIRSYNIEFDNTKYGYLSISDKKIALPPETYGKYIVTTNKSEPIKIAIIKDYKIEIKNILINGEEDSFIKTESENNILYEGTISCKEGSNIIELK